MKEASGELNMTVITIVAIAAVGALFYVFVWPMIQTSIASQTCKTYGPDWHAVRGSDVATGSNAKVSKWYCCPKGVSTVDGGCVDADSTDTANNG